MVQIGNVFYDLRQQDWEERQETKKEYESGFWCHKHFREELSNNQINQGSEEVYVCGVRGERAKKMSGENDLSSVSLSSGSVMNEQRRCFRYVKGRRFSMSRCFE